MQKSTAVKLPLMGEGVHEATIVEWLKNPGEAIDQDEPLVSVSTDKVDTEIPAPASGFLISTFAEPGQAIVVDQVIAQIAADKDAAPMSADEIAAAGGAGQPGAATRQSSSPAVSNAKGPPSMDQVATDRLGEGLPSGSRGQSPMPGTYAGMVRSSPLVRQMAREHGIDLRMITGTGLHGRITKDDFQAYLSSGGARVPQFSDQEDQTPLGLGAIHKQKTVTKDGVETLEGVPVRREKMNKIRWLTAEHMLESVRTSPHVSTAIEVDLNGVAQHRQSTKASMGEAAQRLTFTAYFIEAAIQAIAAFPEVNTSVDGDEILYKDEINIGCAVAIESGLIVPVIKRANDLSLLQCADSLADIADRARNGKLKPEDIKGGTFSITNPGMYGSLHSQPIINQPQVAIMSVGAIVKRPVVIEDEIVIHPTCQIGLTFDHRIVDGEGGAKFLAHLKQRLESYGRSS